MTRITLVDGHPDADPGRYVHAIAAAYAEGAVAGGHEVRNIMVAALDFPIIRTRAQWEHGPVPNDIRVAQEAVKWAEHVVFFYPLWLGDIPALLKGFMEQLSRPDWAFENVAKGKSRTLLDGRSARVIVTLGMPAPAYAWIYHAHSLKSFKRNILKQVGFGPVRHTLIGPVEGSDGQRRKWLDTVRKLGRKGR